MSALQIQYMNWRGEWENLGKPRIGSDFSEWWNAYLRNMNCRTDKFGIKMLRAVNESGDVVSGIGSKDYNEYVSMREDAQ